MQVVFYYRNGCHLCEEMAAVLHQSWPDVFKQMIWIDVDSQDDVRRKYGNQVPVLLVDGNEIAHFFLDEELVKEYFGAPVIQV